jgi:hypothetical protein
LAHPLLRLLQLLTQDDRLPMGMAPYALNDSPVQDRFLNSGVQALLAEAVNHSANGGLITDRAPGPSTRFWQ